MTPWQEMATTVILAVLASSGLWAFLGRIFDRNTAEKEMLKGLGHDRISSRCMKYIERGWITKDEYEDLNIYLYEPYKKLGGNGSATKLMNEVNKLPMRNGRPYGGKNENDSE